MDENIMDIGMDDDESDSGGSSSSTHDTSDSSTVDTDQGLAKRVLEFCGGPDLVEVFGPSGSCKSEFTVEVLNSAISGGDKDALFIDTENNVGDLDRIGHSDYVYVPEWHDIYAYVTGKENMLSDDPFGDNTTNSNSLQEGYDVVVLDSIGFPALIQYGEYRVADNADQFKVFNELQVITGKLKQYSQRNDALIIVINQPKSDLSGEDEPNPFGDKAIFGFKEIWKTNKNSSNEVKTKCEVNAFRSRQAGRGKTLYEVEVSDDGTEVDDVSDETGGGWT